MMDDAHGVHDYVYDARNADILVSINGELKHRDEATVSVFESGYLLGDGVWEGMRVHAGGVAFLSEHLKRLYAGAKTIDMDIGLSPAELTQRLFDCLKAQDMSDGVHIRMMVTRGRVSGDDTVLVMGASGGVGTACVLLAKRVGATVISCASSEDKLARLAQIGSDHGINYIEQNMREATWNLVGKPRITGEGGVDLLVNCTGSGTWTESTRCMSKGARLVTCGATAGFEDNVDIRYIWTYEHSLLGSNGWHRSDIEAMLSYAADGSLVPVIDKVMPLEEVHEAERLMENRSVFGKIVLTP